MCFNLKDILTKEVESMGVLKNIVMNSLLESETDQDFVDMVCEGLMLDSNPFKGIPLTEGFKQKTPWELLKEIMLQVNQLQDLLGEGEQFTSTESIAQIAFLKNQNEKLTEEIAKLKGN